MKRFILSYVILLFAGLCSAQSFETKLGEEIAVAKGSVYLRPLLHDETGTWFLKMENKTGKSCLYALDKYDKYMNTVYDNCIEKYTGDKNVQEIVTVQKRIYVFFSEWKKKKFTLYCLELDKTSGNAIGKEKLIKEWELEDRNNEYDLRIKPGADSLNILITATNDSRTDNAYHFISVDTNLNIVYNIKADTRFTENQVFEMENVVIGSSNSVIFTGRLFNIVREGRQKRWEFSRLVVQYYDVKGKRLADVTPRLQDKNIVSFQVFRVPGTDNICMAGIYAGTKKGESAPAGLFFSALNPDMSFGSVSYKEFAATDIQKWKSEEKYPGINNYIFYDFLFDKDRNHIFLFAETYDYKEERGVYWYNNPTKNPMPGRPDYQLTAKERSYLNDSKNIFTYIYHCGEMIVTDINLQSSAINRYYTIDKKQVEIVAENPDNNFPGIYNSFTDRQPSNYINGIGIAPFYSSFFAFRINDKLYIVYNQQDEIPQPKRRKDKDDYPDFYDSRLNSVSINLNSGEVSEKMILPNSDAPVYMPRLAYVSGNELFIPAMKITQKLKGSCKMAKVVIKD